MPKQPRNAVNQDDASQLPDDPSQDLDLDEEEADERDGFQRAAEFQRVEKPITVLTVLVDRDAHMKIPTTIYEHELPVLEEIYGEDAVQVVDEREAVTTLTAGEAHRQLLQKYKQHHGIVRSLYRNAGTLARRFGLPQNAADNTKGGAAPPAIDYSGSANQDLLGSGQLVEPGETRRL